MTGKLRPLRQLRWLGADIVAAIRRGANQSGPPANIDRLTAFLKSLPATARAIVADDAKLLIAWTSEAAAFEDFAGDGFQVEASSSFGAVPGFLPPADLTPLKAAYRIAMPPLKGHGYYGLLFAMTVEEEPAAMLLVNRLFRLPYVLQEPGGVLADVATVGALLFGVQTASIQGAITSAMRACEKAAALGLPLIFCGQSLAGGLAQYQTAVLMAGRGRERGKIGFLTFNAAHAAVSIRRLGLEPQNVPGINFSKDRDPGVGPYSLLPNRVGLQIYVHSDGSGGFAPGSGNIRSALIHPLEHFLSSFRTVNLAGILRQLNVI